MENLRELGWYFLSRTAATTAGKCLELVNQAEPEEAFDIRASELADFGINADFAEMAEYEKLRDPGMLAEELRAAEEKGVRFISRENPEFPAEFLSLPDPPAGIYVRGQLPGKDAPKVSIVGSRRCSPYGRECAFFFGKELALRGVNIVSGMALGADGCAGSGAADAFRILSQGEDGFPGTTTAILGGGPDICYPRENIALYKAITDGAGCVLSEKPPGYRARPFDFPRRNRLISALGSCLAVIEAAERSGTRTTVDFALSLGKDVFAVPGRIGERMSSGCNELIKNGASILTCPEDILQYLGLAVSGDTEKPVEILLTPEEAEIWELIGEENASVDELLDKSGFPVSAVLEILVRLEIKGAVRKDAVSGYARTGKRCRARGI